MFFIELLKKISISIICSVFLFTSYSVSASTVFTYRDANGQILITNKPNPAQNLSLVKRVSFRAYRDRGSSSNPYFSKGTKSKYDALIINLSNEYGVEPALVKAIIHIESAFRADAVSRAGAMGLMQLMPATARIYNLNNNFFEPRKNMHAGIAHLKYLLERYDDNTTLSLAAYNAGEGAVARYKGIPPYEETQNYVAKVLKLYGKYQQSFTG